MTRTRFTLNDLGHELSWNSLYSFVVGLPDDSRLARAISPVDPVLDAWLSGRLTPFLIADLIDTTGVYMAGVLNALGGKGRVKHKPYKRPIPDEKNSTRYGSDAIPISEIENWWHDGS